MGDTTLLVQPILAPIDLVHQVQLILDILDRAVFRQFVDEPPNLLLERGHFCFCRHVRTSLFPSLIGGISIHAGERLYPIIPKSAK